MNHNWAPAQIDSGREGRKKGQRSDGFVCANCKLNAKAPSGQIKDWKPPAEGCR